MSIEIVMVKTKNLKPAEYNPRLMSKHDADQLAHSMTEFGVVDPIIVNSHPSRNNIIIGGHQRINIAKANGYTEVPVVYVPIEDIKREQELNLRLNRNTGEWDWDKIANEFDVDFLKDVGFTDKELQAIPADDIEEDTIPEAPKKARAKKGQIYLLGRHRLMCGDSTKKDDVEKLMDGKKADMVFTDPPYSVNYEKKQNEVLKNKSYNHIENDDMKIKEIAEKIWRHSFRNLFDNAKDDCSFYMTMPQGGDQMMMMMMSENWIVKHELIWVKPSPVFSMGRLNYDYKHEPIMFGWKKTHNWYGRGKFKNSIWEIGRESDKSHPTMKPIELISNAINNSSKENDLIVDIFLGSGSTLIASEKTNRTCYGMEIDPIYCDVIIERYCNLVGADKEEIYGKAER